MKTNANAEAITAIEAAVALSPANHDLRVHFAALVLAAGRPEEAMKHAGLVLADEPDNTNALKTALRAATALGHTDRAQRYGRLLEALGEKIATVTDSPVPVIDAEGIEEDEDEPASSATEKVLRMEVVHGGLADESWRLERSELKLADVAGMQAVKRRLDLSIFALLRHSEMREYYRRSLRGGLLLYGPPGCGKTFIARATAGELGARFLPVGLSDVLDMYVGQSERKLHELFETARRNAPCVMFIDEIDALGRRRALQRSGAERNLVNQLLAEMDGTAGNDGVFVLGATNHMWDVDTALRRPGRFDRTIFVGPPDADARRGVLAFHMRDRAADAIDWGVIVGATDGFSGADLAHLCETAAECAMEESIQVGRVRPIQMRDFRAALKEVRPSTRAWLETARDYAMFANEGGAYDDLLAFLRSNRIT